MKSSKRKKTARCLRYTARAILLIVAIFWFVFALLSGSERFGGGIRGIVMNSPNALPWLILFAFTYVAWRWELVGGSLIALIGFITIFMFDAFEEPFVLIAISLPLIMLGGSFITSWYLTRKKEPKHKHKMS
ncbi:hypothetical protein JXB31_02120 [Candidatus Woesearchaeota archaeon]|nr:hypothetical protein [Candidatus Woesearchaeota archaeon]